RRRLPTLPSRTRPRSTCAPCRPDRAGRRHLRRLLYQRTVTIRASRPVSVGRRRDRGVLAGRPTEAPTSRHLTSLPRVLAVSHPAVLAVNQLPYAELRRLGWDPFLVTPNAWRNQYETAPFAPEALPELAGRLAGRRVALAGRHQRHVYLTRIAKL